MGPPGFCLDLADSIQGRGTSVPSLVMDLPVLHPFVRELAESDRFRAFLEELPETRARVSEPALPLVVSALYERVEQAQERGQFAFRGGIVDVYPTTGREPLRIELFGDEVESIRAFSP